MRFTANEVGRYEMNAKKRLRITASVSSNFVDL